MKNLFKALDAKEWLELNAKLQAKKNALRKALKEKGILKKGAENKFDNYTYFSEAQYKELFTELFSDNGLELKFNELEYNTFDGTKKQANGRATKLEFYLFDVETGFFETTAITGEGIDKGDKAGYKAYTGALKYFLADTFMVATGDDPEKDSPGEKMNNKSKPLSQQRATAKQIEYIKRLVDDKNITALLSYYKIAKLEDLKQAQASAIIEKKKAAYEAANKEMQGVVQGDYKNG